MQLDVTIKPIALLDLCCFLMEATEDGQFPKHLSPDSVYPVIKAALKYDWRLIQDPSFSVWVTAHRDTILEWQEKQSG